MNNNDILFLSSLCSVKEYNRMFDMYGTTSSHASQKLNRLICKGLVGNNCRVYTASIRVINQIDRNDKTPIDEIEDDIHFHYLNNVKSKKANRIYLIIQAIIYILKWYKKHTHGVIICDTICGELSIAQKIAAIINHSIYSVGLVTDVPIIRADSVKTNKINHIKSLIKNYLITSYKSFIFLTQEMNGLLNKKRKPYVIIEGIADPSILENDTSASQGEKKICMMAGLLEPDFGVEMLLDAFSKTNVDAELWFFGKGSSVSTIVEASNNDSRIKYLGEKPNHEIVIEEKRASLLINPRLSHKEWTAYSFPSKNIEYMASGTPLVACNLPCIPKEYLDYFYVVIDESENGFYEVLNSLLKKDSIELKQFGKKAQEWIITNKNPYIQTNKIVKMLERDQQNV